MYILISGKLADLIYSFQTRVLSRFNKGMADYVNKCFMQILELLKD